MRESSSFGSQVSPVRISEWVAYPKLNRLRGPEGEVHLEPRLMSVLMCLAMAEGGVLSRDELLDLVWGDVVVGEEALTRTISELRRILGDNSRSPRYIETIRKGGYRLIPEVEILPPEVQKSPTVSALDDETREPNPGGRPLWLWLLLAIAVAASAWVVGQRGTNPAPSVAPLRSMPLTAYPGNETTPALSPDGSLVAFAWTGADNGDMDIYVKRIGDEPPLRLTDDPGWDIYPVWGPDIDAIDYVHVDQKGHGIWRVPLLGGEPRLLVQGRHQIQGFTWLDENTLVYADVETPNGPCRLFIRDFQTDEDRQLANPSDDFSDYLPLIDPDGKTLAFLRSEPSGVTDIHLLDIDSQQVRQLTRGLANIEGMCWDRSGSSLVFATRMNGNYTLWRAAIASGDIQWVPVHGEWMFYPSIARDADRMAYQHRWFEKNVWRVSLGDDPSTGLITAPVITSSRWDCEAYYSPDGQHLAFTSSRSGHLEIWACQADGTHPVQLTHFGGPSVGTPAWSPNGSSVAFAASPEGFSSLFVADYADRSQIRVSDKNFHDLSPSWSGDGRWLYCGSNRSGAWQIWQLPADGDTTLPPIQLTTHGGMRAREATDGRHLYFSRHNEPGLWRVPLVDGKVIGPVEQVLDDLPRRGDWSNWDLWAGGVVLVDRNDEGPFLLIHDFSSGQTKVVTNVPNVASPSVTISPDGRNLLYARIESSIEDLVLVDDFH